MSLPLPFLSIVIKSFTHLSSCKSSPSTTNCLLKQYCYAQDQQNHVTYITPLLVADLSNAQVGH